MTPPPLHPKSLAARLAKAQTVDGGNAQLISITEAAARLRIGHSVMKRLIKERQIATVKIGHSRRVVVESLNKYIQTLLEKE